MLSNRSARLLRTVIPAVAAFAWAVGVPSPASAQLSCIFKFENTPASPPPAALWSPGIKPAYDELPSGMTPGFPSRDTTWDPRTGNFGLGNPYWWSLDIEGNYLYAAINKGFQVWDIGGPGNQTDPERRSNTGVDTLAINSAQPHSTEVVRDVDAAPGDVDLAAITGAFNMGFVAVDTNATGGSPSRIYQDHGRSGSEVYVTKIGSKYYGYMAVEQGSDNGIWSYDLTQARAIGPCTESLPGDPSCPNVFVSRLNQEWVSHLHGADDGANHFVVASGGSTSNRGFDIWRVTNPAAPALVLSGLSAERVDGVAMWHDPAQNKFFLALAARGSNGTGPHRGLIYDVTCIRTGCGSLGNPVYDFPLAGYTQPHRASVTFSRSGGSTGTPYVYFGSKFSATNTGLQTEWLFDVTGISPTSVIRDVTGGDPRNGNTGQPVITVDGIQLGYWSWYYACRPADGSNWFQPHTGLVKGDYFYRSGHSILDIHEIGEATPLITVSGPPQGYTGQSLEFNASATGCTPSGNWTWQVTGGGQIIGPSTGSSVDVQWSTTGSKTVLASNTNGCPGAEQVGATINILNAQPAIGSVTATPTTAPVCTQITFQANNVTGQPPLTYAWTVEQGGNPVPNEGGTTNPFVWDTEGISPGTYQGRVVVNGDGGSAQGLSPFVNLTSLPALPANGFPITNDPPVLGAVQFHSNVAGATEWRWDFGDGTILQTQDPAQGENPLHVYTEVGDYDVTLQVRNCVDTTFRTSASLPITIVEVQQLEILEFEAICTIAPCVFSTGQAITFSHIIIGQPTNYMYDWNGDGQFEQSSATQVNTHTYTVPGNYTPALKVTMGSQTDTFTAPLVPVVSGGPLPQPSVNITGPTSRNIGQQGTFTAFASNCTPNPNGWTWSTGGGTGSSTTSSITLSWSSPGQKVISVGNSGCGSASDTHGVNVIDPGGGGPGQLNAAFTFSPSDPGAGQTVSFDASSSTGQIIDWIWNFGDGQNGTGEQATHVYDEPGTYNVVLTVGEINPACQQGICLDTANHLVTVGEGGGGNGECVPNATTICLLDGRFKVTGHWHNHRNGETGVAKVYTPFSGDRTGMFWFFSPDNVELIVKSLDATSFPDPAYWFFYGGLSDVEYWINVVDTVTEEEKEYHNEPTVICGMPDTSAFPQEPQTEEPEPEPVVTGGTALGAAGAFGDGAAAVDLGVITGAGSSGTCAPNGDNLCLLDGRFSIEVEWHDQHNNDDGIGHPIIGTDRTGYFWFFNADNIELVLKMIDGRVVNDHFWLLWGGLSDVEYTIRVTDTVTQTTREWGNPPGSFCGGAAANAFPAE